MKKYKKTWISLALFVFVIFGQVIAATSEVNALTVSIKPNLQSAAYNKDNIFTVCGFKGECTWFTYGRVLEKLNIKLPSGFYGNGGEWWDGNIRNQVYNYGSEPKADSIIVWSGGKYGYGHVGYVEKVEGDLVYFNEANYSVRGNYEGNVKVMTKEAIKNRGNIFLTGYIYIKEKYTGQNPKTVSYGQVNLPSDSPYLNVRSGAGTNYARIGTLINNTKVTILEKSSNWYKIQFNNSIGYVCADYIKSVTNNSATYGQVNLPSDSPYLNVRSGAGTNYARIGTLTNNTKVTILEKSGNWYKIQFNGSTGYVCVDYIKSVTNNSETYGQVNLSSDSPYLNVRSGAGTNYARIGGLANKTKVTILEKSGNWYKIKFNNATGYVCVDYIVKL